MRIEHIAFNVADPVAIADWYCQHLGFSVKHQVDGAPYTHFLADITGRVMIEIYNNPSDHVPDYESMNPLLLHLSFVSEDPIGDGARLIDVGCTAVDDVKLPDGSHFKMLKDPWGFAIKLSKRGNSMV